MQTVGIIGGGFVGHATARVWMEHAEVKVYDVDLRRSTHSKQEASACDFVFVCLPTPAKEDGSCDTSAIDDYFGWLRSVEDESSVYIVKSTVPVGTTRRLHSASRTGNVVHSPEFLTARCAVTDAHLPARNIVGYPRDCDGWATLRLRTLYEQRFPGIPSHVMSSDESELVKLVVNGFFAVKVWYFNELQTLSHKLGCRWEFVIDGILSDGRIAHAHTQVPGHDGKRGFGGACLPKDLANLATTIGEDATALRAILKRNAEMRGTA